MRNSHRQKESKEAQNMHIRGFPEQKKMVRTKKNLNKLDFS